MHCSNLPYGAGPYVDECGELSSAPRQYDLEFGELPTLSRHRCSHRVASPTTDIPWAGPSKALGEVRGLLLSVVGERFEP
jgi:hypothetical protein